MKHCQGLTLFELLISLAILAILVSAGAPSLVDLQQRLIHRQANSQVEYFLHQARENAISLGRPVRIVFQTLPWCFGATVETECNCNIKNSCTLNSKESVMSHKDFKGVVLNELKFAKAKTAQFDPILGTSLGYNGSFLLTSDVATVKIIISALGRTRFCLVKGRLGSIREC